MVTRPGAALAGSFSAPASIRRRFSKYTSLDAVCRLNGNFIGEMLRMRNIPQPFGYMRRSDKNIRAADGKSLTFKQIRAADAEVGAARDG